LNAKKDKTMFVSTCVTKWKTPFKARIRLEIRIEIGLTFDQSKQSSLNF